ncbi:universal stress protein [Streptomyces sp. NBC_00690]|uniref:universal stress protein n=1 Tax=Streptomyces sp. NBC_00690 TaxID=2975808 RepID=UPI002E283EDB|nr:universal stress protein [Streptomyces sp. NBC_00690]
MTVVAWIVEGTWPACVDAVRRYGVGESGIVLLHVSGPQVPGVARGAYAGLLGRGQREADPGERVVELAAQSADRLLTAAAQRLALPCTRLERTGRVEREVVEAASGAELLVLARDGDLTRPGPHSLGPASRFVVDHAPCPVLLVWPGPVTAGPGGPQAPGPPPRP